MTRPKRDRVQQQLRPNVAAAARRARQVDVVVVRRQASHAISRNAQPCRRSNRQMSTLRFLIVFPNFMLKKLDFFLK
jgi:hypothetical protein